MGDAGEGLIAFDTLTWKVVIVRQIFRVWLSQRVPRIRTLCTVIHDNDRTCSYS